MLKDVKSPIIISKIFSFVDELTKLQLAKYNKRLQKIIHISINNYIHYRGIYIIYESNRIGKEYDGKYKNHRLMFEGEFLNGKRNGKGKEYDDFDGKIKFEGEYLNGKRWKGKEYDVVRNLIFEGEYLMERNGMEKEQNINLMIIIINII